MFLKLLFSSKNFNCYSFGLIFIFTVYSFLKLYPMFQVSFPQNSNDAIQQITLICLQRLSFCVHIIYIFVLKKNLKEFSLRFLIKSSYNIKIKFFKRFAMKVVQIFVSKEKSLFSIFTPPAVGEAEF